uniref:Uncharacterized protein n=1 Tax=Anguilla anguilla TaxID=7936 RepID=A0A0E9XY50_ANGAN
MPALAYLFINICLSRFIPTKNEHKKVMTGNIVITVEVLTVII